MNLPCYALLSLHQWHRMVLQYCSSGHFLGRYIIQPDLLLWQAGVHGSFQSEYPEWSGHEYLAPEHQSAASFPVNLKKLAHGLAAFKFFRQTLSTWAPVFVCSANLLYPSLSLTRFLLSSCRQSPPACFCLLIWFIYTVSLLSTYFFFLSSSSHFLFCFPPTWRHPSPPLLSSPLLSSYPPHPLSLLPPIRHRLPETLSNWWRCQTMVGPWESTWCLSVAGTAGKNIHSCRGAAPNKVDHSYGEERVKVIVFPT